MPSPQEGKAMSQMLTVLHRHPIVLLAPDNMECAHYLHLGFDENQVMRLPVKHFDGIAAYNEMLCNRWFYRLFEPYKYLLIMQNDAWVFRDELDDWVNKGYDYAGSPWLWKPEPVKQKTIVDLWPLMKNKVGNGGVSLRYIPYFIKYGKKANLIYRLIRKNEDFVWLLTDRLSFRKMRKPTIQDALRFCIEMEPAKSMAAIDNQLPFTTHAYERYGAEFWKQYGVG